MIRISTDSTCDLTSEMIKENNFAVIPLIVNLGEDTFYDGQTITTDDIYSYVARTKDLPKTAARSIDEFIEYFTELTKNGDQIIHIGISSELSCNCRNSQLAAEEIGLDKVRIIDGKSLSVGTGLLILSGAEKIRAGKSFEDIIKELEEEVEKVQISFVVDRLDYLHKGGRCSGFSFAIGSMIKIKPRLQLIDGKIINTGKEIGPLKAILKKYIDATLQKYPNFRKNRCYIAHTKINEDILTFIEDYIKSKNLFDEVKPFVAGSVITSHCGEGTLGIGYICE